MARNGQNALTWRGNVIRVVGKDGVLWFVVADVTKALGLVNPSMVVKSQVRTQDKAMVRIDTLGGPQSFLAVNEIGLYDIILSARSPIAKEFEKWVAGTMLPKLGSKAPDAPVQHDEGARQNGSRKSQE